MNSYPSSQGVPRDSTGFPNLTVLCDYLKHCTGKDGACITKKGKVNVRLRQSLVGIKVDKHFHLVIEIGDELKIQSIPMISIQRYIDVINSNVDDVQHIRVILDFEKVPEISTGPDGKVAGELIPLIDCPDIRSALGVDALSAEGSSLVGVIYRKPHSSSLSDTLASMLAKDCVSKDT